MNLSSYIMISIVVAIFGNANIAFGAPCDIMQIIGAFKKDEGLARDFATCIQPNMDNFDEISKGDKTKIAKMCATPSCKSLLSKVKSNAVATKMLNCEFGERLETNIEKVLFKVDGICQKLDKPSTTMPSTTVPIITKPSTLKPVQVTDAPTSKPVPTTTHSNC